MIPTRLSSAELAERGDALYVQSLRDMVETDENIGKMIVIDVETGDYEIDRLGTTAGQRLLDKHPEAQLWGIRIGYKAAETVGGIRERDLR